MMDEDPYYNSSLSFEQNFEQNDQSFDQNTDDESRDQFNEEMSTNFVEMSNNYPENGARSKIFCNIIDDSPLQNQIQRNKECKTFKIAPF